MLLETIFHSTPGAYACLAIAGAVYGVQQSDARFPVTRPIPVVASALSLLAVLAYAYWVAPLAQFGALVFLAATLTTGPLWTAVLARKLPGLDRVSLGRRLQLAFISDRRLKRESEHLAG